MIPRARANFTARDLMRAAIVSESSTTSRDRLSGLLENLHGIEHVLLAPSGRGALYAILRALGRPVMVVPAYTCNAVVEAAQLAGVRVVYAEAEPDGFNSPAFAMAALASEDTVVLATHQFGIPCEISDTVAQCHAKGALVVEDCAASLGTRVGGRLTGTFGDAAFFSFDSSKLVHVPMKGGAIVASDRALAISIGAVLEAEFEPMPALAKARTLALGSTLLAIQGPHRYRAFHTLQFQRKGTFTAESHEMAQERNGFYRYTLAEWQAAVAVPQVERLHSLVATRRRLYATYRERLAGARAFALPPVDLHEEWAPIRFPIRVRTGDKLAFYREAVKRGVDFAFSFTFIAAPPEMRAAHALANSVLDLPFYEGLTGDELDRVVTVLLELDRQCAL
jgi:dTDP-4-amino-4,6-dideoxygalactose transaminase